MIRIDINFFCLACFPQDLLSVCPPYAVLSERKSEIEAEYQREFSAMMDLLYDELRWQERNKTRNFDEEIEEEGGEISENNGSSQVGSIQRQPLAQNADESDFDFCDYLSGSEMSDELPCGFVEGLPSDDDSLRELQQKIDQFNAENRSITALSSETIDQMVASRRKVICPHRAGVQNSRVTFKDSYLLLRGSLGKLSGNITSNKLQSKYCQKSPPPSTASGAEIHGHFGEKVLNLGKRKSCDCCKNRFHVPTGAPELLKFSQICLGQRDLVTSILHKVENFPHGILDLWDAPGLTSFPSKEKFKNSLRDDKEITDAEYSKFHSFCQTLGLIRPDNQVNLKDLILIYAWGDVQSLSLLLCVTSDYLYTEFGLNLLQFGSISRFAYELLLKESSKRLGFESTAGLSYVNDRKTFDLVSKSKNGGFLSSTYFGKKLTCNNIYGDDFSLSDPQTFSLPTGKGGGDAWEIGAL